MHLKKNIMATIVALAASTALAEPPPKAVDLSKIFLLYKQAGYSSLDLMETTKKVLISGVVLDVSESLSNNLILKVGARANSQELARLAAADHGEEKKMQKLQAGARFKAVCDLAFTSGTQYMSFQECVFR